MPTAKETLSLSTSTTGRNVMERQSDSFLKLQEALRANGCGSQDITNALNELRATIIEGDANESLPTGDPV